MEIDRPYIAVHIDSDDRTTPHVHCVFEELLGLSVSSTACAAAVAYIRYSTPLMNGEPQHVQYTRTVVLRAKRNASHGT